MAARGPKIPGARFSEKKILFFFNFIGPVTPPWVMYPSEIMHMGSTERLVYWPEQCLQSQLKCLDGSQGPQNPGARFSEKKADFFEIHRTSDSSVGSAALPNHANGLYGAFTSKSGVYKVN